MAELDSEARLIEIDRGRMIDALRGHAQQIGMTLDANAEFRPPARIRSVRRAVVVGVGGSAVAGDVVRDWLIQERDFSVDVCRSTVLPKLVDSRTLAICVSYSGNTAETMNLFEQLRKRKCPIVSVTSGGRLTAASERRRVPVVQVEPGRLPRAALPSLIAAIIVALNQAVDGRILLRSLRESEQVLSDVTVRYDSVQPTEKNEAKIFATQLFERWIHVLALERDQCLARRFVAELNENSKLPASHSLVPEFAHNMIEGWPFTVGERQLPLALVAFRGRNESGFERHLYSEGLMLLAERANARLLEFTPRSSGRLAELFESIAFGDWVSYYLAIIRGVDPSEMPAITEYKRRIA